MTSLAPTGRIHARRRPVLLSFKEDYEASFPLDDAEGWIAIMGRCRGHTFFAENVDTYIAVLKEGNTPVGATVGEHYKGSGVLLVTL